jgi:excisionase family DNA binding protein
MPEGTVLPGRVPRSMEHPLMSVSDAARALGFSGMTVRRRIKARRFPAVTMGTKAMVPRAFVTAVLKEAHSGRTVVVEEFAEEWMASSPAEDLAPSVSVVGAR